MGTVVRTFVRLAVVCFAALAASQRAAAQPTTDRGASVVTWPKVVADASHDTVLQLVNLSDNRVNAYCSYVDGTSGTWEALDFTLALGQRPVHWSAAQGRTTQPGEDPIEIPAVPAAFRGELLCVQVDATGAPFSGNELAGQSIVTDLTTGDVESYTAIGLRGSGLNDGDDTLCIGGQPSDTCLLGAEYDACPAEWILSFPADGAEDAQLGAGSSLTTRLTIIPCTQDLNGGTGSSVAIHVVVVNAFGSRFTAEMSATCWADLALGNVAGQVFTRAVLGTDYADARLQPAAGSGGFIVVAQTTRTTGGAAPIASAVGINVQHRFMNPGEDTIVLPAGRGAP